MNFYIISPKQNCHEFNPQNLEKISNYIKINYFQLRPKYKNQDDNIKFIEKNFKSFSKVCQKRKIKFILNDNISLAKKLNFDGVHLGQNDTNCAVAREILGREKIIGISCNNSIKLAKEAEKNGADYVAFGPIYKSSTKISDSPFVEKQNLSIISKNLKIPFTLIGGINHKNFLPLLSFKPLNIALINSIWNFSNGSIESAKLFKYKIEKNKV